MCLGVPGQIVELKESTATVDCWGVKKLVRLDNLTELVVRGDYIIEHAGYAVRVIPAQDVADTLALYETILAEAGEDPIVRDVVEELERQPALV